jgi:hypothetical protein
VDQGLVDEIRLLVHPVIVGTKSFSMFSDMMRNLEVILMKCEGLEKHCVWLDYQVKKKRNLLLIETIFFLVVLSQLGKIRPHNYAHSVSRILGRW